MHIRSRLAHVIYIVVQGELRKVVFLLEHHLSANSVTLVHRLMITASNSCRINKEIQGN